MYRDRVKPLKQKGHGYEIDAYWSLQGEKTLKTGYDHIWNMATNQILLKLHVSRQEIAVGFFYFPENTFPALTYQHNALSVPLTSTEVGRGALFELRPFH